MIRPCTMFCSFAIAAAACAAPTFEATPNWGVKGDGGQGLSATHGGVVVDQAGRIYVSGHTGVHVFDVSGKKVHSLTGQGCQDIHAMTLVEEEGVEYIYGARNKAAEYIKMTTEGRIITRVPYPEAAGQNEKGYQPTGIAVNPNGNVLVADGYGSNYIFEFDPAGKYLSSFGGQSSEDPEKFWTPHGLAIDTRYDPVRLLVADREKRRLVHFDLEGNYLGELITGLRRPCAVSIRGDHVAIAELEGRVVILDGANQIVMKLGDNPVKAQWASYKVAPEAWKPDIHTAPHGLSWDANGNLYVQDWNANGRVTKWRVK